MQDAIDGGTLHRLYDPEPQCPPCRGGGSSRGRLSDLDLDALRPTRRPSPRADGPAPRGRPRAVRRRARRSSTTWTRSSARAAGRHPPRVHRRGERQRRRHLHPRDAAHGHLPHRPGPPRGPEGPAAPRPTSGRLPGRSEVGKARYTAWSSPETRKGRCSRSRPLRKRPFQRHRPLRGAERRQRQHELAARPARRRPHDRRHGYSQGGAAVWDQLTNQSEGGPGSTRRSSSPRWAAPTERGARVCTRGRSTARRRSRWPTKPIPPR